MAFARRKLCLPAKGEAFLERWWLLSRILTPRPRAKGISSDSVEFPLLSSCDYFFSALKKLLLQMAPSRGQGKDFGGPNLYSKNLYSVGAPVEAGISEIATIETLEEVQAFGRGNKMKRTIFKQIASEYTPKKHRYQLSPPVNCKCKKTKIP